MEIRHGDGIRGNDGPDGDLSSIHWDVPSYNSADRPLRSARKDCQYVPDQPASGALSAAAAALAAVSLHAGAPAAPADHPPPLAIGAPAPDFSLPGIDGKTYTLASFKDAKALVVVFTAVHCPTAEVYEGRLKRLVADYKPKGVAFAVIQPNNAKAVRLDEMGYTDLGDSLEDMKLRAAHRTFAFPFLYDGETQEATAKYGPTATPHVFVFDAARKLRYQGRIDSSPREAYAKVADTRLALDAVLAGARCRSRRRRRSAARSSGSTRRRSTTRRRPRSRRSR